VVVHRWNNSRNTTTRNVPLPLALPLALARLSELLAASHSSDQDLVTDR
jgi:hypothetical protein